MSKVVSIPESTYEKVVGTTGKLMDITKQPSSMSEIVTLSIDAAQSLFKIVLDEAQADPNYRESLTKALKRDDQETILNLLLKALR
jgi:hypothetical protein